MGASNVLGAALLESLGRPRPVQDPTGGVGPLTLLAFGCLDLTALWGPTPPWALPARGPRGPNSRGHSPKQKVATLPLQQHSLASPG